MRSNPNDPRRAHVRTRTTPSCYICLAMMIVMSPQASADQVRQAIESVEAHGFQVHRSDGQTHTVLGCVGVWLEGFDPRTFELLRGVVQVIRISSPYKLASRTFKPENTVIELPGGVTVGGGEVAIMAGPCTIESKEQ